jgi:hypothetical protein
MEHLSDRLIHGHYQSDSYGADDCECDNGPDAMDLAKEAKIERSLRDDDRSQRTDQV